MRDRRSFAGRVLPLFLLALAAARAAAAISPESEHGAPAEAAGAGSSSRSWSFGAGAYLYLVEDDSFLMPILTADRGSLHLEGRYQYEDVDSASVWVGWSFGTGSRLHLEVVPMVGLVLGNTNGVAPGLEATLSWKSLELYSESEYVFDAEGTEGDFFYNWSELTWRALPWLRLGLTGQRTRMYDSELAVDRGLFAAVAFGAVEISLYGFNLDGENPFAVMALAVEF
jgi:hypothetical protein